MDRTFIGNGTHSKVFKTYDPQAGRQVALKRVKTTGMPPRMRKQLSREIKISSSLSHPNLLRVYRSVEMEGTTELYMEYFPSTTLDQCRQALNERHVLLIMSQLRDCFVYLQSRSIMHRDIKPQNVLINDDLEVRLVDFGYSKVLNSRDELSETICGTPLYMPPEVMAGRPYDMHSELWSMGILLYYMLFGEHPLHNLANNMRELQTMVEADAVGEAIRSRRDDLSPGCYHMLEAMCRLDTAQRLTFDEFRHHSWLKTGDDFSTCVIENYADRNSMTSAPIMIPGKQMPVHRGIMPSSFTNFLNISVELFKCSMTDYFHSV